MNILNLPGWEVLHVRHTKHDYHVEAIYAQYPARCIHCGQEGELFAGKLYHHGTRNQTIMDLPAHGKRVGIELRRVRFRCKDCSKTFLQPLPDVDDRKSMTRRLATYIEEQSVQKTFTAVASEVGVDEKTVRNLFSAYVARLDKEVVFVTPEWLGLDEVHLLKKPRLIATNLKERTIIALLDARKKKTVAAYLDGLKDKDNVKVVAIDMWKAYRDAANANLPKATVIVDKFHVVRLASICMEKVRKRLRQDITPQERRRLMHDRFLLLRRPSSLKAGQQLLLDAILGRFPVLEKAYRLKEGFYRVYDHATKEEAWEAFRAWEDSADTEMKTAFKEVLTAVYNWKTEILAYFDHRATNALTEALNGIAKGIQRTGRGYSFKAIRAKLLYSQGIQKRPIYGAEPCEYPAEYAVPVPVSPTYGSSVDALAEMVGSHLNDSTRDVEEEEGGNGTTSTPDSG